LYVLNYGSDDVSIIDTITDTVIDTLSVEDSPGSAQLIGTQLYIISLNSTNISIIDTTTDTVNTIANV
jgi:YVTN family beta-propeller protein